MGWFSVRLSQKKDDMNVWLGQVCLQHTEYMGHTRFEGDESNHICMHSTGEVRRLVGKKKLATGRGVECL